MLYMRWIVQPHGCSSSYPAAALPLVDMSLRITIL